MRALASSEAQAPLVIGVSTAPGQMQFAAHSPRAVLHGGEAGERDNATLAGGISGAVPVPADARGRRDRHDAPSRPILRSFEMRQCVLHGQERAGEIDRQHLVEGLDGHLRDRREIVADEHSGRRHDAVQTPELGDRALHCSCDRVGVGDIGGESDGRALGPGDGGVDAGLVTIEDRRAPPRAATASAVA